MRLLSNNVVNTGRQFEFDLAKAVCILGMVFVHCFEMLAQETVLHSNEYYMVVIVLDAIFGAGTFMVCMGLGIAYTNNNTPNALMKRGLFIFVSGYLLNFVRACLPLSVFYFLGYSPLQYQIIDFLSNDILMFAGLALILIGFLKKMKLCDWGIFVVALVMSIVGSFVRMIDIGPYWLNQIVGDLIGTVDEFDPIITMSSFPLMNWFIVVVYGYLMGQFLRRCTKLETYYAISFPISGVVLCVFLCIAIPNRWGIVSGDIIYYYQMTTLDSLILLAGAVFATGLYHYVSKLLSEKIKSFVILLSKNINRVYCIHWVILFWIYIGFQACEFEGMSTLEIILTAIVLYLIANILAEVARRQKERKKKTVKNN